jgi:6-phosphogluconate dehydrogenase
MAESAQAKPQPAERLGYVGLGLMGVPMTRRLLAAGYEVAIWNRSSARSLALQDFRQFPARASSLSTSRRFIRMPRAQLLRG